MTLAQQYRQYVVPLLRASFEQVVCASGRLLSSRGYLITSPALPTTDLSSILRKEAMYCAIGRCATRLKDEIPFERWLDTTLQSEARETNPRYSPRYDPVSTMVTHLLLSVIRSSSAGSLG